MRIFLNVIFYLVVISLSSNAQEVKQTKVKYGAFSFDKEVTLPGTPEIIFDAVTGDISG